MLRRRGNWNWRDSILSSRIDRRPRRISWRINTSNTPPYVPLWPEWNYNHNAAAVEPSVQSKLAAETITGWHPFVTAINMRDWRIKDGYTAQPIASIAYIDKVKAYAETNTQGDVYISPSTAGCSNYVYALDNVRHASGYEQAGNPENFSPDGYQISSVTNALIAAGVAASHIVYFDGLETNGAVNPPHITNAVNVAGYVCWGVHSELGSFYAAPAPDANSIPVKWSGSSGWWIIETIESFNGMPFNGHGDYFKWFTDDAFGGTNYSNTPVGAVTHTDEPYLENMNNASDYFGLWARGASFSYCAWISKKISIFRR